MYLAVLVAYDMYLEVSEGDIDQTWKDDNIVDFWKICYLLSYHTIKYNPTHIKYSGASNMILLYIITNQKEKIARMKQGEKEGGH